MTALVTLTFRHMSRSGTLESSARYIGQRLNQLDHRMTACHIVLEGKGGGVAAAAYQVKIHLSVPGAQIHAESLHAEARNPLHSAYENAKRQLEKLRRLHNRVFSGPG